MVGVFLIGKFRKNLHSIYDDDRDKAFEDGEYDILDECGMFLRRKDVEDYICSKFSKCKDDYFVVEVR